MTETLEDDMQMDDSEYFLIRKTWKVQNRVGGGVAFVFRMERNFRCMKLCHE